MTYKVVRRALCGVALVSGVVLLICGMKKIREYKNAFENNPFKYEL